MEIYNPETHWGEFKLRTQEGTFIAKYVVGHAHEICPRCGSYGVLSFGVPINDDTAAIYPFHWCCCGYK